MKKKKLFTFLYLLICSFHFAQIPDAYQKKLFQYQDEMKTNPQAAQKKLLTLIDEAEKKKLPLVSIRGYEVFAYHYAVSGNSQNAIKYAQAAIELSDQYDYPAEAAAMYGTIGQQYGQMGMDDLAKEYLQKGIDLIKTPKNDEEKHHLGNLYSYHMYTKETSKDSSQIYLKYAKLALNTYLTIENKELREKTSVLGYGNVGMCYSELKQYDSAIAALDKVLAINNGKNPYMSGSSYLQKGMLFLDKKQPDSAEVNLKKSEQNFAGKGFLNEEKELYAQFIKLYEIKGDQNKLKEYRSAYLELENKVQKSKLGAATEIIKTENKEKKSITSNFYKVAIGLGLVIIALLTLLSLQRRKHIREKTAFEAFRKSRASEESNSTVRSYKPESYDEFEKPETSESSEAYLDQRKKIVSEETEGRLLRALEAFEEKYGYNEKGISLGKIATKLGTNTKYLSFVIKKHRADNFSNYINGLRINYILQKIENEFEYRKYKVSYLAEESGFSSASAFTKVFNDVTGVSPSSYINLIGKEG